MIHYSQLCRNKREDVNLEKGKKDKGGPLSARCLGHSKERCNFSCWDIRDKNRHFTHTPKCKGGGGEYSRQKQQHKAAFTREQKTVLMKETGKK